MKFRDYLTEQEQIDENIKRILLLVGARIGMKLVGKVAKIMRERNKQRQVAQMNKLIDANQTVWGFDKREVKKFQHEMENALLNSTIEAATELFVGKVQRVT
jgi:hypothetical protein